MIYACKNTVSSILITAISIQSTLRYLPLQQLRENLEKSSYSNSLLAGHRSNLRNLNMTKTIIFARMSRQIIYAIRTYKGYGEDPVLTNSALHPYFICKETLYAHTGVTLSTLQPPNIPEQSSEGLTQMLYVSNHIRVKYFHQ